MKPSAAQVRPLPHPGAVFWFMPRIPTFPWHHGTLCTWEDSSKSPFPLPRVWPLVPPQEREEGAEHPGRDWGAAGSSGTFLYLALASEELSPHLASCPISALQHLVWVRG